MIKDKAKLVARQITDKTGKKTTVWVNPNQKTPDKKGTQKDSAPNKKEASQKVDEKNLTPEQVEDLIHHGKKLMMDAKHAHKKDVGVIKEKLESLKNHGKPKGDNGGQAGSQSVTDENNAPPAGKVEQENTSGKKAKDGTIQESKRQVVTDLKRFARLANYAKSKGESAPNFNLCSISIPNTNMFCKKNKGVERKDMPQLKGKAQAGTEAAMIAKRTGKEEVSGEEQFKDMLSDLGVEMTEKSVNADTLMATQNELVGAKVAGMMMALEKDPNHEGITAPILVSRDGYVLDGHHRWAAMVASKMSTGKPPKMDVVEVDMDMDELLEYANRFTEEFGIAQKAADANNEGVDKNNKAQASSKGSKKSDKEK